MALAKTKKAIMQDILRQAVTSNDEQAAGTHIRNAYATETSGGIRITDGVRYFKVPNATIETLYRPGLTSDDRKLCAFLIRWTYGYKRLSFDNLNLRKMMEKAGFCDKKNLVASLHHLVEKGLIKIERRTYDPRGTGSRRPGRNVYTILF